MRLQAPAVARPAAGASRQLRRSARPLLTVEEVSIRFGGVEALRSISLDVRPGAITALIGPNGAGKTTTFNCVSGIYRPDKGRILIQDRPVTGSAPQLRPQLGLARTYQQPQIFADLTVRENLDMGLRMQERLGRRFLFAPALNRASRGEKATEIARLCGYEGPLDAYADSLSFGALRVVEVARALCLAPDLLMLDEPAAGLDVHSITALTGLLASLRDTGVGVLLIEHDMGVVMGLADDIVVLDFGEVIARGSAAEVRRSPKVIEAYLGDQGGNDA